MPTASAAEYASRVVLMSPSCLFYSLPTCPSSPSRQTSPAVGGLRLGKPMIARSLSRRSAQRQGGPHRPVLPPPHPTHLAYPTYPPYLTYPTHLPYLIRSCQFVST